MESFSLLYLNPPYDFEIGEGKNQRMEKLFLDEFFRWLKPGGVLVLVIPFDLIYECRNVLSPHFKDKSIYRLTESDSVRYKQAVVLGVRRSLAEKRERLGFSRPAPWSNFHCFEVLRGGELCQHLRLCPRQPKPPP